jgi:glutaredoxin
MDAIAHRILQLFDELKKESLDLHALLELAGGNAPENREAVLDAVARMEERGWLRAAGSDVYERTEDGRLAIAYPLDVTLYTRAGCQLCEEAKEQMAPLLGEYGASLREVDVDADPVLHERYTNDVPVIFLGSRKVAKHRLDLDQFRRQLARARS